MLAAGVALALGACASAAEQQEYYGFAAAPGDEKTIVQVENQYFGDMTIYLLNGGSRTRLGRVGTMSSAAFEIPNGLLGFSDVRLLAEPLGPDAGFTSEPLLVSPGSKIELRLASHLPMSYYSVW
ncbi:MAG: hypothetical protein ACT443_13825 [Gemmatimonadota bacterium]